MCGGCGGGSGGGGGGSGGDGRGGETLMLTLGQSLYSSRHTNHLIYLWKAWNIPLRCGWQVHQAKDAAE